MPSLSVEMFAELYTSGIGVVWLTGMQYRLLR